MEKIETFQREPFKFITKNWNVKQIINEKTFVVAIFQTISLTHDLFNHLSYWFWENSMNFEVWVSFPAEFLTNSRALFTFFIQQDENFEELDKLWASSEDVIAFAEKLEGSSTLQGRFKK